MFSFALGVLLLFSAPLPPEDPEKCLTTGSQHLPSPVTTLNEAQRVWTGETSISPDTLRAVLTRVKRTRECLLEATSSEGGRSHLDDIFHTYELEAELRASLRQFDKALQAFENGRSLLRSQSPTDLTNLKRAWPARLHQQQGYLHYLLGDLSASIGQYLNAFESTPETEPDRQAQFLLDVGTLHQRTQDYRSARLYFRRAGRHLQAASSEEHIALRARLYHVRSDLLLEKTLNTSFSRDTLRQAADLAERGLALAPSGSARSARVSLALSEILGYLGNFDRAYSLNRNVRRYARSSEASRLQAFSLLKRGVLHVQTERWQQADSTLLNALALAEALGALDYQRRILRTLGRLHEMQGNWSAAEQFYRDGIDVVETYRESLTASQWSMTAFAQWRDVHRGLVRTLLSQERPHEALAVLDRSRARHLQDLRTQARVSEDLPPEERTHLDSLSRSLTHVRNRLGEASSLPDSTEAHLRNRESALMAARQQLLQLDSDASRLSIETIKKTLRDQDRALVSYFLDDPWPVYDRSPRSVAFVLTGDSLRTVPLPGLTRDSIRAHLERISPLFTSRSKPERANAMHFDLRPLHRLYDAVYAPIAESLPAERPLTVIPDGPLFHLPFSMLVRSMPGGRYAPADARFVLHERPTALELASSLVVDTARRSFDWSRLDPQMAAYGVSDFDTLQTVPPALRSAIPKVLGDSSLALPPLPGVREELRALESTVPGARVFLNDRATEADFCRSARRGGVLHVASHAFVNASSPLRNAILLRPDTASGSSSDGVLFLHELQGQQARIPMVVLSGCNTASGTLRGGEGMEGLQYAFRAMGAKSTVSTLWPVADRVSVDIMDAFYRHLRAGHPKDVALRQAQLDFLETHPQKASPFFWAPPVLYGSPAALPLDDPFLPLWAWWALGTAGLLLLAGGLLWWNRNRLPPPFC